MTARRSSIQMLHYTPSRVWQETSGLPFALPTPIDRIYRYRLGANTFIGPWHPASVSRRTAPEALAEEYRTVVARALAAVHRRAMSELLNSERAKALLRRQRLSWPAIR